MVRIQTTQDGFRAVAPKVILGGLSNHYRVIGNELLLIEQSHGPYRYRSEGVSSQFREDITCISTQILESYLDDLLDREVQEDRLFIERKSALWSHCFIPLIGALLAVASGLYAASIGASIVVSFCLTVLMLFPFVVLLYSAPRSGLMRRMAFAQIVSHEILRRRGGSDFESATGLRGAGVKIGGLLVGQRASGSFSGATRAAW